MKSWVEVNRGALLRVFHGAMVALRRHSVNLAVTVGVRFNGLNALLGPTAALHGKRCVSGGPVLSDHL